jgi:GAF domain-containing protein
MLRNLFRERRRSRAVRELTENDTLGGQVFDRFVNAAAAAFGAPIAAVSLIHGNEQLIKASYGFPLGCIPRAKGFCSFTLDGPSALECVDPQSDPRFATLPGVLGEPHARYYIGAPLRLLNGIDVGALCVVDTVCRKPASDDQKAYLVGLARQAATTLESRLDLWGHAA